MCGICGYIYLGHTTPDKDVLHRTDYERSALPLATIGTQEYVTDDHRY